ncbi:proton-conducting transporter membrane subunit [Streptomyces fungicidicus]|uniref:proton-conducting transporter transmembrane domain-containing protein n=1 Tax=Streptomyces fungicidicus TaxID=68203 RepID=UPI003D71CFB5
MMVIAVGLSCYNIALFHLVNHAFYKALLFLGAGAVIHAVADNQDFRRYGGLINYLPLTYSVMLIASLSLVAFPFMTGFYSKDLILESAYGQFHFSSTVVYIIATIGAMFTTLYSVKVLYLTFLTNPNGPISHYRKISPSYERHLLKRHIEEWEFEVYGRIPLSHEMDIRYIGDMPYLDFSYKYLLGYAGRKARMCDKTARDGGISMSLPAG